MHCSPDLVSTLSDTVKINMYFRTILFINLSHGTEEIAQHCKHNDLESLIQFLQKFVKPNVKRSGAVTCSKPFFRMLSCGIVPPSSDLISNALAPVFRYPQTATKMFQVAYHSANLEKTNR